jgi:hypothetical protein
MTFFSILLEPPAVAHALVRAVSRLVSTPEAQTLHVKQSPCVRMSSAAYEKSGLAEVHCLLLLIIGALPICRCLQKAPLRSLHLA